MYLGEGNVSHEQSEVNVLKSRHIQSVSLTRVQKALRDLDAAIDYTRKRRDAEQAQLTRLCKIREVWLQRKDA